MNELYHHGILGQKWGVRRYQYEDGSYTPEGKKRYGIGDFAKDRIADKSDRRAHANRQEYKLRMIPYDEHLNNNNVKIRKLESKRDYMSSDLKYKESANRNMSERYRKLKYENPVNVGQKFINSILDSKAGSYEKAADQWKEYEQFITNHYNKQISSYAKSNDIIEKAKEDKRIKYERYAQQSEDMANRIRGR